MLLASFSLCCYVIAFGVGSIISLFLIFKSEDRRRYFMGCMINGVFGLPLLVAVLFFLAMLFGKDTQCIGVIGLFGVVAIAYFIRELIRKNESLDRFVSFFETEQSADSKGQSLFEGLTKGPTFVTRVTFIMLIPVMTTASAYFIIWLFTR
jgi:cell division protein FtsW (lipid II flippase)